MKRLFC